LRLDCLFDVHDWCWVSGLSRVCHKHHASPCKRGACSADSLASAQGTPAKSSPALQGFSNEAVEVTILVDNKGRAAVQIVSRPEIEGTSVAVPQLLAMIHALTQELKAKDAIISSLRSSSPPPTNAEEYDSDEIDPDIPMTPTRSDETSQDEVLLAYIRACINIQPEVISSILLRPSFSHHSRRQL
jgi:hypothetical protein